MSTEEGAELWEDPIEEDQAVLTVTEAERDKLQEQFKRFQSTAEQDADPVDQLKKARAEIARLEAAISSAGAASSAIPVDASGTVELDPPPAVATPVTWTALDDLRLDFNAEPSLLPSVQDPMPKDIEGALDMLAALLAAVPWGITLPAITFQQLGVGPPMVHTLLGNTMWTECWGERHSRVNNHNYVPTKMMNILKWLTEQASLHLATTALKEGKDRYFMVAEEAAERRKGGAPY